MLDFFLQMIRRCLNPGSANALDLQLQYHVCWRPEDTSGYDTNRHGLNGVLQILHYKHSWYITYVDFVARSRYLRQG